MAAIDDYVRDYNGRQNVSFDGIPANAGQCVQPIGYYVRDYLHKPIIYVDAIELKALADKYPNDWQWIPNAGSAVPQPGDVVLWNGSLPNSGGAGHVAACIIPRPGTGTFISFDSNWGGKYCHQVIHNYDYVAGWLRPKYAAAPAPSAAVAQPQGDKPMTPDEEKDAYQIVLERPMEGAASGRSGIAFIREALPELNIKRQAIADQLAAMSGNINTSNATITDLTTKLTDSTISNQEKQKALDDAVTKLAAANAELTAAHDTIIDLQNNVKPGTTASVQSPALSKPPTANWLYSLLATLTKWKVKK